MSDLLLQGHAKPSVLSISSKDRKKLKHIVVEIRADQVLFCAPPSRTSAAVSALGALVCARRPSLHVLHSIPVADIKKITVQRYSARYDGPRPAAPLRRCRCRFPFRTLSLSSGPATHNPPPHPHPTRVPALPS